MNGIEVDLSEVIFEPRKIQLTFFQEAESLAAFWSAYNKLYAEMSAPGYRTLTAISGMATQLRLANTSAYKIPVPFNVNNMHTVFSLDFIEDNPNIGSSEGTIGNNAPYGMYQINGIDFGEFGIGADDKADDLIKYTSLKDAFTDGRTIYADHVRTAHKTIKLSLWMLASNPSEFLNNWRAFFTQLSQPGMQLLYFDAAGISVEVYYSDCPSFNVERWDERLVSARFAISLIVPQVDWISRGAVHYGKLCLT
jgi:hypothetical protein